MQRLEFIAQRVLKGVVVLLGIIVLNFALIRMAPGDPATVMAGEAGAADEIFLEQLRKEFGLDRPFHEQLFVYVKNVVTFDLGYSYRQQRPVGDILAERVPPTLLLTGAAFCASLVAGVLLGVLASALVGRWSDSLITVIALFFYATPIFWVGLMGILLFSVTLGWLPSFGMYTVGANLTGFAVRARRGAPPHPADDHAGAVPHGGLCAHDARLDAGDEGPGLRAHGARQGPAREPDHARPHPAQRASCR